MIEDGAVTFTAQAPGTKPQAPKSTHKVRAHETYQLTIPETVALDLTPATNITLDIIYEDDDIVILNKPAGMTVRT